MNVLEEAEVIRNRASLSVCVLCNSQRQVWLTWPMVQLLKLVQGWIIGIAHPRHTGQICCSPDGLWTCC